MGVSVVLAAITIGMSLASTLSKNQALGDQNRAFAEENALQQLELTRQQEQVNVQAGERKSDTARRADADFALMIVSMADGGGAGGVNQLRFGADIGGIEGIDLARIEGNRRRQVESIQSRKEGSTIRTRSRIKANVSKGRGNILSFLGGAASSAASFGGSATKTT